MNKKVLFSLIGAVILAIGAFLGINNTGNVTAPNGQQLITSENLVSNMMTQFDDANNYTVYVTKSGKKYHKSNCRYVLGKKVSIIKQDAINQGYTACKHCKPDAGYAPTAPQPTLPKPAPGETKKQPTDNGDDIILE